jgi:carbamate kinase
MDKARKEAWFVVINGGGGVPVPMTAGDGDTVALFATEDEAYAVAAGNMLAEARGYSVYEWTFPVDERFYHKG